MRLNYCLILLDAGREWGFCSRSVVLSCSGLEADRLDQCVKVIDDAVIEAVELRPVLGRGFGVGTDGAEEASSKRGIDSFQKVQEHQTNSTNLREGLISARA